MVPVEIITYVSSFFKSTKDNFGNEYDNATIMRIHEHYNSGWFGNESVYITYNCTNYSNLSGTIAMTEDTKSSSKKCTFKLIGITSSGKEKTLYEKAIVAPFTPQKLKVDVSSYSMIKISLTSDERTKDTLKLILSDFTLSK